MTQSRDMRELTRKIFNTDDDDTDGIERSPPPPPLDDDDDDSYKDKRDSGDTRLSLIATSMSQRAKWESDDEGFTASEGEVTVYGDDDDYVSSMSGDSSESEGLRKRVQLRMGAQENHGPKPDGEPLGGIQREKGTGKTQGLPMGCVTCSLEGGLGLKNITKLTCMALHSNDMARHTHDTIHYMTYILTWHDIPHVVSCHKVCRSM